MAKVGTPLHSLLEKASFTVPSPFISCFREEGRKDGQNKDTLNKRNKQEDKRDEINLSYNLKNLVTSASN
jgi:hypothetical protein